MITPIWACSGGRARTEPPGIVHGYAQQANGKHIYWNVMNLYNRHRRRVDSCISDGRHGGNRGFLCISIFVGCLFVRSRHRPLTRLRQRICPACIFNILPSIIWVDINWNVRHRIAGFVCMCFDYLNTNGLAEWNELVRHGRVNGLRIFRNVSMSVFECTFGAQ